jgi:hypothetical protein
MSLSKNKVMSKIIPTIEPENALEVSNLFLVFDTGKTINCIQFLLFSLLEYRA